VLPTQLLDELPECAPYRRPVPHALSGKLQNPLSSQNPLLLPFVHWELLVQWHDGARTITAEPLGLRPTKQSFSSRIKAVGGAEHSV
jgi:hypothetical protein